MTTNKVTTKENNFLNLGLNVNITKALNSIYYKTPTPIQQKCIPLLLKGFDILGLAQTGSGKTAAFALPLLNKININLKIPQILILVPTRELAIQVTQSIHEFAKFIKKINIVALYGGQSYQSQLNILRKGAQVVIGTPGRLLDHLNRRTLNLSKINFLVLDEADEMLRMGFIEDVESIMKKIPEQHQTALFSATMPSAIRKISQRFMKNPKEINIQSGINRLPPDIKQFYCLIYENKKNILINFLEVENYDAVIVFVNTKTETLELSEILKQHGYNSSPLNGDMNQNLREKTIEKLKKGFIHILVATDVAARGLDIDRISLVINYDVPINVDAYIHRIGRTGRAGRSGKALLFIKMNERFLLKKFEKKIKSKILETKVPGKELIFKNRLEKFIQKIKLQIEKNNKEYSFDDLKKYQDILSYITTEIKLDINALSLPLLQIAEGQQSLVLDKKEKNNRKKLTQYKKNKTKNFIKYQINIGNSEKLQVRDIIYTFCNEFKLNKKDIGKIKIFKKYSTLSLSKKITHGNFIKILGNSIRIKLLKDQKFNHYKNKRINSNKVYNRKKF